MFKRILVLPFAAALASHVSVVFDSFPLSGLRGVP